MKGSRSIIRKALQQLESAGLIEEDKPKGRKVTKQGRKLLHEISEAVIERIVAQTPESGESLKGE